MHNKNKVVQCKYCGRSVIWLRNENGNPIPVDSAKVWVIPDVTAREKFYFDEEIRTSSGLVNMHTTGRIVEERTPDVEFVYRSHMITCPVWSGLKTHKPRKAKKPLGCDEQPRLAAPPSKPPEPAQMSLF